ncbi:PREDICTED: alcohol dehydrogenase-like isoform X2 [Rhagoletis zephyria]|uniref:alcohol dehydrogenase-like isoform X2 n=1 Tax=Rhagoletis zephyria TaxID=28612 RepID=UPI0008116610|nr:PREDICTED: alcohol dehydrogenase-like isoform X2 [Rhagoletis zephyria]XP_036320947.1 alcohol dehydrogenase-like isoform X1 [Rhagoletis pomonella]
MAHNVEENTFNLYAKNVVYIGGFGGIGVETCKQLLQKGVANLMILDKTWNESAHKELNAVDTQRVFQFMEFDITCGLDKTRQVFARIMEKFGYIDVLINGAGICDEQDYDLIIAVNFTGTINATLVAYDLMDRSRDGQGGVVVNISSVAALTPFPVLPIYSGTKGGVLSFTRALSHLEPKTGITLYTICPGITDTKHWDNVNYFQRKSLHLKERSRGKTFPSQTPVDCATNIVKIIEANQNGSTWMCDMGQRKMVEIKNFWCPNKQNEEGQTCHKTLHPRKRVCNNDVRVID